MSPPPLSQADFGDKCENVYSPGGEYGEDFAYEDRSEFLDRVYLPDNPWTKDKTEFFGSLKIPLGDDEVIFSAFDLNLDNWIVKDKDSKKCPRKARGFSKEAVQTAINKVAEDGSSNGNRVKYWLNKELKRK